VQLEQTQPAHIITRLWAYQEERFPAIAHGILIAVFSLSAISYSMLLRGALFLAGRTPFAIECAASSRARRKTSGAGL
jgi:hypothetical protein